MEYGMRSRLAGQAWLESLYAGGPLAAAAAAYPQLLLSSLQHSSQHAMQLLWEPAKREPPDDEPDEPDEDDTGSTGGDSGKRTAEHEEDNEPGNHDSWKETPMPVLSSWMLGAYTTMLSRLTAATAALEAADGSNPSSDSDSESDRSSFTDKLSRESSPSSSVRQTLYPINRTKESGTRTKKKRTSDCKPRAKNGFKSNNNNNNNNNNHNNNNNNDDDNDNDNGKESSSSDAAVTDASSTTSHGKKRSLALQRVRYEREEYRCSLCSYACTIEKAFQRHLRAHARGTASDSRVSCAVCGADRSSEVDLSKHMRRHRDNRYFCCDICIFRTVQLKKLIQHRRMHTGEKPHLCPHCAYRSARRDNLRSHVRRVHKKENLYCDTFSPRGMFIAPKLQRLPLAADNDEAAEQPPEQPPEQPSDLS